MPNKDILKCLFAVVYNPLNVIFKSERLFSAFVVYAVHTVYPMFSPVNILVDIYFSAPASNKPRNWLVTVA